MIKKITCLIGISFYFITVFSETNQVSQIISRLNQIEHYRGEALFRVTLPMTDEEVEYKLSSISEKPGRYLIRIFLFHRSHIRKQSGNKRKFHLLRLRKLLQFQQSQIARISCGRRSCTFL